ncbi:MAG TPA: hypothetical protein VFB59_03830 [Candidatus Saccharimonadales bacterium]|nr:hypothetical protein [Candidatus Saccharimonadales bacterium]
MSSYLSRISAGSAEVWAPTIITQATFPEAATITPPDVLLPFETIQLPGPTSQTEPTKPPLDKWAQETWEGFMEIPESCGGKPIEEIDEMWLAYKEAMAEPTPPPRSAKTKIPQRPPGRVYNPTWDENTDTYTNATQKTLYFGVAALTNWRLDIEE